MSTCSNCGKALVVVVPENKHAIQPAPGFVKKELADDHLDLVSRCEFGCEYCSTDNSLWQSLHKKSVAQLTREQLGEPLPGCDHSKPSLVWEHVEAVLERDLLPGRSGRVGTGKTIVVSMLTDPFSPLLVENGVTLRALQLLIERSDYARIRVLTKSVLVTRPEFMQLFLDHRERFVVGLSIGSLDAPWSRRVERRVPAPAARVHALHRLQDAGIQTYGMLCPVFPHAMNGEGVEQLVRAMRPEKLETIWAEPFNSRSNWKEVRDAHSPEDRKWFDEAFAGPRESRDRVWSRYATELYERLRDEGARAEWSSKLRYLLYEDRIVRDDSPTFADGLRDGSVLLQSAPDEDGTSRNPAIAELQPASSGSGARRARRRLPVLEIESDADDATKHVEAMTAVATDEHDVPEPEDEMTSNVPDPSDSPASSAKFYAQRGWHVLPLYGLGGDNGMCTCGAGASCSSPGAHPLDGLALTDATSDVSRIAGWWADQPSANVGVVAGEASGIAVLAVDESLLDAKVRPAVDPLLATATPTIQRTGRATTEILFASPGDREVGTDLARGLDYVGGDALIVAPPSQLPLGRVRWSRGSHLPLVALPFTFAELSVTLEAAATGIISAEPQGASTEPTEQPRLFTASIEPVLIQMSTIELRPVKWFLPNLIPSGELTMLGGHPSAGKSAVMTDLVARVTTGAAAPLGGEPMRRGSAIIMCREEDPASAIRPRLEAAGADMDRVFLLNDVREAYGGERGVRVPYDIEIIERACRRHEVRLVVLDPITDFLHRTDANAEQDVRRALLPLVQLARTLDVAIVFVRHLGKRDQANALHQGIGSVGFGAVARAGLVIEKDGENRVMRVTKSSLCPDGQLALRFQIVSTPTAVGGSVGRVEWLDRVAHDVLPAATAIDRAKAFLVKELANGPVLARVVLDRARVARVAERNLRQAKKELGIEARGKPSYWHPPAQGCNTASA